MNDNALEDGVALLLTRDSVACTIGMNVPHNGRLWDRGVRLLETTQETPTLDNNSERHLWAQINSSINLKLTIDDGHLLQSFEFWRRTGFMDSKVSAFLGLDGIHEAAVYSVGIGYRDASDQGNNPIPSMS